jgi:GNAT superfamily N-acetyltransferase
MNLAENTRLAFEQDGRLVGSLFLESRRHAKYFVATPILPGYNDSRLGAYLLKVAETWVHERQGRAEQGVRISLNSWIPAHDLAALDYYSQAGYQEAHRIWNMEIALNEPPAPAKWPEGLELRPFVPGRDDRLVFEMMMDAFDHYWSNMPNNFAMFQSSTVQQPTFDPSLWFIAYEGDLLAGGVLCKSEGKLGWIDTVATRRPWRRKGLALALLRHAFGEFHRRGLTRAGLRVDPQNVTNAPQLYRRAGMDIVRDSICFAKEIRPGKEVSK